MTVQKMSTLCGQTLRVELRQPAEKRKEARYQANEAVDVRLLPSDGHYMPATIIDISKSGLGLEMGRALLKGTRIEIMTSSRKLVIFGEIRHCGRVGGVFHMGVLIEGVVVAKDADITHLSDDDIALYVVGKGLTVPEVLRVKDHLLKCDICSRRMTDTAATLYPCKHRRANNND